MDFTKHLGLGIAGNFALHLDQAGEAEDFKDVITEDEAAPKGMFPFYLPCDAPQNPQQKRPAPTLFTYPLSSQTITLPQTKGNLQAEPEVVLECDIEYKKGKIAGITPKRFGAYNDCSIRVAGAEKISDKKNWGKNSKGIAANLFEIESFDEGSTIDKFRICSFLEDSEGLHLYGEDVELTGYSYFHSKLLHWIQNQLNTQKEFGPLEPILEYISTCNEPQKVLISIGATRYTEFGEHRFLQEGDTVVVVVYDATKHSPKEIQERVANKDFDLQSMSVLQQRVVS